MIRAKSFMSQCFLLLGLLAMVGCVERKLTINTNPSGAQVFLNDEEIGVSPVTVSFNWYGDYNVRISRPGSETLHTHRQLPPPWYDHFPFDFIAQALYPGRIVDSHQWSFDLAAQKEMNSQELIRSAQQLKNQASQ